MKGKKAICAIADFLIEKKLATKRVNYRLRDWGISRQRYWGTPIPMVYCKHCGDVPVNESYLPVLLPDDLIPTEHGSPLKNSPDFIKTKCPQCKKAAKRETDTMDTFMESSWYYARLCAYDQQNSMLDDRSKYWTPVDQYVGGIEHAILHLLYARFVHKVLQDLQLLNSKEPFKRLLTQGMVLKNGAKMSKSKGNVVPPQPLIKKYGADTVRLFMIFASPPEQSLEWSDSGVEGAYRFLKKLYHFAMTHQPALQAFKDNAPAISSTSDLPLNELHVILQKANGDIDKQQFNTVVSAGMKILNLLQDVRTDNENSMAFIAEGLSILLRLLAPIVPHITHHLWIALSFGPDILQAPWPVANLKIIQNAEIEMIIQINGKLRGKIKVNPDITEEEIKTQALNHADVQRFLENQAIKRIVVVPKRLINIVI